MQGRLYPTIEVLTAMFALQYCWLARRKWSPLTLEGVHIDEAGLDGVLDGSDAGRSQGLRAGQHAPHRVAHLAHDR